MEHTRFQAYLSTAQPLVLWGGRHAVHLQQTTQQLYAEIAQRDGSKAGNQQENSAALIDVFCRLLGAGRGVRRQKSTSSC